MSLQIYATSQMLDLESNGAIFGPPFLPQNHQLQQSQSGSSSRLAAQPDLQRQTSGGGEDCSFLHVPYVDYRYGAMSETT